MPKEATLNEAVTLRLAKQIEDNTKDGSGDIANELGVALGLQKQKSKKASSRSKEGGKSADAIHDLLKQWIDDHGDDDEAATRLREILASNGYAQAADVLNEDAEPGKKKSASKECGHSHDWRKSDTTSDKIVTVITTLIVALLAILYAHYKDFKV